MLQNLNDHLDTGRLKMKRTNSIFVARNKMRN